MLRVVQSSELLTMAEQCRGQSTHNRASGLGPRALGLRSRV